MERSTRGEELNGVHLFHRSFQGRGKQFFLRSGPEFRNLEAVVVEFCQGFEKKILLARKSRVFALQYMRSSEFWDFLSVWPLYFWGNYSWRRVESFHWTFGKLVRGRSQLFVQVRSWSLELALWSFSSPMLKKSVHWFYLDYMRWLAYNPKLPDDEGLEDRSQTVPSRIKPALTDDP